MADQYLVTANEPTVCTPSKLIGELNALTVTDVRTYTIVGPDNICDGVYPWDASAPDGEYVGIQVASADITRIQQAIAAHVPDAPPPSTTERVAEALDAITNDTSLDIATRTALTNVVQALSGS